ncbi:YitT family protein [Fusibacter tunisiensis]|uniref:YitT family protein n=1 Tax=Fusibacter tunisiensis TaxID=1008308 RepID=UPI0019578451
MFDLNPKKKIYDLLYVVFGSIILAIAITSILKPNGIITGGITGFSLVLEQIFGIKYTYLYYVISIGVLITTYLTLGKREARKIVVYSVTFPVVLIFFERFQFNLTENDLFLASVYYGIMAGAGTGLVLKGGFSSGGTDTIATIINRKLFRFMSVSTIIAALDIGVIIFAAFVFDLRIALYALLTQVVAMKAVEVVLFGFSAKLVKLEIISEYEKDIEVYILNQVRRGISKYNIMGGYTNSGRIKLVTICSLRESILIRDKIAEIDAKAFVSVLPVNSVWGEGVGFDRLTLDQS